MSKSTKIIAALGVVAGLGVAALPAFTYATESATGDVDVLVEVQPAIAMTITGNNDNGSLSGDGVFAAETVTPEEGDNPSEEGWYELVGEAPNQIYVLTTDTKVADGKTYYEYTGGYRSVDSFSPAGAAGKTIDTHSAPAGSIIGTSSSYVSMLPNAYANTTSTVTVYTNNTSGYNLSVKANDSANMIQQGIESPATPDTIAAISSTPAVGTPGWAFKVAAGTGTQAGAIETGFDSDSQMTTTDQDIVSSSAKTSGGDQWVVTYDVATKADQATGVYKVNLTYTATTDNS